MIDTLNLTNKIVNWEQFIKREKSHLVESKSVNNHSHLSHISRQISQLKKELDMSFPEFGDLQEIVATYNLYHQLEILQQQINSKKE